MSVLNVIHGYDLLLHLLGVQLLGNAHSFVSSSMTIPSGHSHNCGGFVVPLLAIIHIGSHDLMKLNLLTQVAWQEGSPAQCFLTCPLTGQGSA